MRDITLFRVNDSLCFFVVCQKEDLKNVDLKNIDGVLIDSVCNEGEARRIVESLRRVGMNRQDLRLAIVGGNNLFNRRVLETMKINYLVSPERGEKRDNLKQGDSGLNHVVAKIAKEKDVSIVINFSDVSSLSGKQLALRLSRIIQNIKICRKAKCKLKIATFAKNQKAIRSQKQLSSFMYSLGASSQQVKDSSVF